MDVYKRLNADEVMCMQMAGMSTERILRTDIDAFDRILFENDELEEYLDKANEILDAQERLGIVTITCHDADFPKRLREIGSDCPAMIHCLGKLSLLHSPKAVAVIGARACDREGYDAAHEIALRYAQEGHVIVSGLALGCDTAAHRAAIETTGATIAVVATGLNLVHPRESEALQAEILAHGGLILSEQPFGVKANPTRLVARNRLQAALSTDVILAQCPAQSGSLHTMRYARKYHRQSHAILFSKVTPANQGNFDLINQHLASPIKL